MTGQTTHQQLLDYARSTTDFAPHLIEPLLPHISNLDTTDARGLSAMHWAVINGHHQLVRLLARWGADINLRMPPSNLLPAEASLLLSPSGRQTERLVTFIVLLQLGSHYPSVTPDIPGYEYQRRIWFEGADIAWQNWIEEDHADLTKLTPRLLIQFTSIGKTPQLWSHPQWPQHRELLLKLFTCPDIPPCHIEQWLHEAPWLGDLLPSPGTHIGTRQLEPATRQPPQR